MSLFFFQLFLMTSSSAFSLIFVYLVFRRPLHLLLDFTLMVVHLLIILQIPTLKAHISAFPLLEKRTAMFLNALFNEMF